jgi:hypothetical protein
VYDDNIGTAEKHFGRHLEGNVIPLSTQHYPMLQRNREELEYLRSRFRLPAKGHRRDGFANIAENLGYSPGA